jgi:hypothetical protein
METCGPCSRATSCVFVKAGCEGVVVAIADSWNAVRVLCSWQADRNIAVNWSCRLGVLCFLGGGVLWQVQTLAMHLSDVSVGMPAATCQARCCGRGVWCFLNLGMQ